MAITYYFILTEIKILCNFKLSSIQPSTTYCDNLTQGLNILNAWRRSVKLTIFMSMMLIDVAIWLFTEAIETIAIDGKWWQF